MNLPDLIEDLALAAVRTQERLDAAYALERPAAWVPRMRLGTMTADVRMLVSRERTREFALGVSHVPLGVQFLHAVSSEHLSQISVTIEQSPVSTSH